MRAPAEKPEHPTKPRGAAGRTAFPCITCLSYKGFPFHGINKLIIIIITIIIIIIITILGRPEGLRQSLLAACT